MCKKYHHLSDGDRWQIYTLLHEGRNYVYIATKIRFHASTIGREIKRNSKNGEYKPVFAQQQYEHRRKEINLGRSKIL